MDNARHRRSVCTRIAYMPQGLGKNLYQEISVRENLAFFATLFGLSASERDARTAPGGRHRLAALSPACRKAVGRHEAKLCAARSSTTPTCSFSMSRRLAWIRCRADSSGI
jgi:hypothetical protein